MELALFIHTFFTQLLLRPFSIYLVVIFCVSAVLNTGNRMRKDFSVVLFLQWWKRWNIYMIVKWFCYIRITLIWWTGNHHYLEWEKRKQSSKNQYEAVLSSSQMLVSQMHKARERNRKDVYKLGSDKLSLFSDDDATIKSSDSASEILQKQTNKKSWNSHGNIKTWNTQSSLELMNNSGCIAILDIDLECRDAIIKAAC